LSLKNTASHCKKRNYYLKHKRKPKVRFQQKIKSLLVRFRNKPKRQMITIRRNQQVLRQARKHNRKQLKKPNNKPKKRNDCKKNSINYASKLLMSMPTASARLRKI